MGRVFVDTNVLFPFSVMDVMLALSEDGVHEVLWTRSLFAEWERVIVRRQRRSVVSATSATAAIREFFPECEVPEQEYAHLVGQMPGADQDDRLHMAAAIAGRSEAIVTWNLADFPSRPLARWGMRVCLPDEYLCELLQAWPDEVLRTVVRLAAEKRRPPLSATDLVRVLSKAGVPVFADRVQSRLDEAGTR